MADEKTPEQPNDLDGAARSDDTAEGAATMVVGPVAGAPVIAQPTGMLIKRTLVVLLVTLGFLAMLFLLYSTRTIILWFVIGAIFAMTLEPAVAWLTRHNLKRGPAAGIVTILTVIVVLGVATLLAVPIVKQASEFVKDVPDYVDELTAPDGYFAWAEDRYNIRDRIGELSPKALDFVMGAGTPMLNAVRTSFSMVAAVVSIFTMMVLLLIEGPKVWAWVLSLVRSDLRDEAGKFGHDLLYSVGGYVRGNGLISVIAGTGAFIAMEIVSWTIATIPFALTLAVIVAILDLIPLVGATIAMIICVLVALTGGWLPALVILIYFIVYQQVENNVIQPWVYSKTVALSPLAVLLATLCGAAIAGIVGVLLAIPAAATVYIGIAQLQDFKRQGLIPDDLDIFGDHVRPGGEPVDAD
jgi:predicted PurR-regulated permease PerM